MDLGHSVQCSFLRLNLQFQVVFSLRGIQCSVIACQYAVIGSSKLPHYDFFQKGLPSGVRLPPADNILPTGRTGLRADTMWYDTDYVMCHIGEIGILWLLFLLLMPPASDIQRPKSTANLHGVEVVIINIWINLPPVVGCFTRWIQIGLCCCRYGCCAIHSSVCRFRHSLNHSVFFIIPAQIVCIKRRLIKSRGLSREKEIAARNILGFDDGHLSMFGTVLVLPILQKRLLVLDCIKSLVLSINIHSLVPHCIRSHLPETIEDMCQKEKHSSCFSYFSILYC